MLTFEARLFGLINVDGEFDIGEILESLSSTALKRR